MNQIIIKGRLTANPELKVTTSGVNVCNFTVATPRKYNKEEADFLYCEAWRATAEFVNKFFKKGQEILLNGELHIEKYEKDGKQQSFTKIVVDNVEFCGGKLEINKTTNNAQTNQNNLNGFMQCDDIDDLPFR